MKLAAPPNIHAGMAAWVVALRDKIPDADGKGAGKHQAESGTQDYREADRRYENDKRTYTTGA